MPCRRCKHPMRPGSDRGRWHPRTGEALGVPRRVSVSSGMKPTAKPCHLDGQLEAARGENFDGRSHDRDATRALAMGYVASSSFRRFTKAVRLVVSQACHTDRAAPDVWYACVAVVVHGKCASNKRRRFGAISRTLSQLSEQLRAYASPATEHDRRARCIAVKCDRRTAGAADYGYGREDFGLVTF